MNMLIIFPNNPFIPSGYLYIFSAVLENLVFSEHVYTNNTTV